MFSLQPLAYDDLILHLAADGPANYRIHASCGQEREVGCFEPPAEFRQPPASGTGSLRIVQGPPAHEEALPLPTKSWTPEEAGDRLFRALLQGRVRDLFQRAVGRIESQPRTGLRLRIHIDFLDSRTSWLTRLPWELLFWVEDHRFLALSRTSPIVRGSVVSRPVRALSMAGPLDILAVAASPTGLPQLDLARERRDLESALASGVFAWATFVEPRSAEELRRIWSRKAFQVFHYMGHGGFDAASGHGRIVLAGSDGSPEPLVDNHLIELLDRDAPPALVVLNACHSAAGHTIPQHYPSGLAPSLILAGLPAVVAMRRAIPDQAAIAWSGAFYAALASGQPLEAAVAEGRKAVHCWNPSATDWAIPALFLGHSGDLFAHGGKHPDMPAKPEPPTRRTSVKIDGIEDVRELVLVGRSAGGAGGEPIAPGPPDTRPPENTIHRPPGLTDRVELATGTIRRVDKARIVASEEKS